MEVYCNGQWGTVCDNGFGRTEADTVCRQLGYERASDYNHLSMYEYDLHHNNIDVILTLNLFEWPACEHMPPLTKKCFTAIYYLHLCNQN